mmetsp:Transcript_13038/g.39412  ORF Transcript_13038/g.39412 Transcript_13038/m.39412 type:complete len:251 (+) Transcript_13038:302-1054(+)
MIATIATHATRNLRTGLWFESQRSSRASEAVRFIVRCRTTVSVMNSITVPMVVSSTCRIGTVHRECLVVGSQTMTMCIRIAEQTTLQHFVGAGTNAWNEVTRREGGLLHLRKVVLRIAVEHHTTDWDQWVVCVWPNLGHIERIPTIGPCVCLRHDLDVKTPRGYVSVGQVLKEITGGVVRISASQTLGFGRREIANASLRLEVILDVVDRTCFVVPLKGVARVPVHVTIAGRCSAIREQNSDLMNTLRSQ